MEILAESQRTLNLLAIQKPAVTARLIRQVAGMKITVVLDLEDSLWDVDDPDHTRELKAGARRDLLGLAKAHPEIFRDNKIGIRINRCSSDEFSADLGVLSEVAQTLPLSVIVPTKVESAKELRQCRQALSDSGVACEAITPIVETVNGMRQLPEIALAAVEMHMPAIIYGHYDYCLSAGLWPFPEFDETSCWELIEPFMIQVENAGLSFVQPPFFSMYDDVAFLGVLGELVRKCRHPFGVLTFGPRQTRMCSEVAKGNIRFDRIELRSSVQLSHEEKTQHAMELIQAYHSHQLENKGFAVDPRTGRFIAPHQYAAAKLYLGEWHA